MASVQLLLTLATPAYMAADAAPKPLGQRARRTRRFDFITAETLEG